MLKSFLIVYSLLKQLLLSFNKFKYESWTYLKKTNVILFYKKIKACDILFKNIAGSQSFLFVFIFFQFIHIIFTVFRDCSFIIWNIYFIFQNNFLKTTTVVIIFYFKKMCVEDSKIPQFQNKSPHLIRWHESLLLYTPITSLTQIITHIKRINNKKNMLKYNK